MSILWRKERYPTLYHKLLNIVRDNGYFHMKMNLSTIMPHTIKHVKLIDIFQEAPVNIYYSMYSNNEVFNKYFG
jgi:hypothetical protein